MKIYDILKNDHDQVKEMLSRLVSLPEDDDSRFDLIKKIDQELVDHSRAEEAVFYNSIRATDADSSIAMHGYKDHVEAESLLRALQGMSKADMKWKDTAKKLKEAVEDHISEEENQFFSEAKKTFSDEEADMMGKAFKKMKVEIQGESDIKKTADTVVNLMPPRVADKIREMGFGPEVEERKNLP